MSCWCLCWCYYMALFNYGDKKAWGVSPTCRCHLESTMLEVVIITIFPKIEDIDLVLLLFSNMSLGKALMKASGTDYLPMRFWVRCLRISGFYWRIPWFEYNICEPVVSLLYFQDGIDNWYECKVKPRCWILFWLCLSYKVLQKYYKKDSYARKHV